MAQKSFVPSAELFAQHNYKQSFMSVSLSELTVVVASVH